MTRLVRGARHDFVEGLLAAIVDRLSDEVLIQPDASLADPRRRSGFLTLKAGVGAESLENILAACDRLAFIEELARKEMPGAVDWLVEITKDLKPRQRGSGLAH